MYSQSFLIAALVAISRVANGQVIIAPSPTGALTSSIYYSCLPEGVGAGPTGMPGTPGASPIFNIIDIDVNVYVEVYVQTFLNICAGGPCEQDYNVTQTCTRDVPCTRPAVPPGFTVTVRECGCAAGTMVTVTEPAATVMPIMTGSPMIPGGGADSGGADGPGGDGGAGGAGGDGGARGAGGAGGAGGDGGDNVVVVSPQGAPQAGPAAQAPAAQGPAAQGSASQGAAPVAAGAPQDGSSGGMAAAGVASNGAPGAEGSASSSGQTAAGQAADGVSVGVDVDSPAQGGMGVAAASGSGAMATGPAPVFTGGAAAMGISTGLMVAVAGVMVAL